MLQTTRNFDQASPSGLSRIRSIFVLCPTWVGDMAMATPIFRALRSSYPHAKITLCMRPSLVGLIAGADWYDAILVYDKKRLHRGIRGWWHFLWTMRKERYDLALILPSSFRGGLISWFTRARIRVGYRRPGSSWMFTHSVAKIREENKFVPTYMGRYYGVLSALVSAPPASMELELPLGQEIREKAGEIWEKAASDRGAPKILLTPGASFGSSKLWPTAHFARLVDLLGQGYRATILISPGPGEEPIAASIRDQARYPVTVLPASEVGLEMLKGIVHEADLLVSNDTGPRHIAHAFKIPSVVTMGSTDPRYSEIDLENTIVLRHPISCSPCHLKTCPIGNLCMIGIAPEQVYEAVRKQMSRSTTPD